jgi:AraC-like DNA-binding protein
MLLNFFSALVITSVFLTFILSVFFLVTSRGDRTNNRILALLLFVFLVNILYSYMTSTYAFMYFTDWHKPMFLLRQTSLLTGPLFYFYIVSFLKKRSVTIGSSLPHFVPFAVAVTVLGWILSRIEHFIIWESPLDLADTVVILLSSFTYLLRIMIILKNEQAGFRGMVSNLRLSSHVTWLQVLSLGFIAIWVVNLNSFALYMILKRPGWCAYTVSIYALTAFLFVNILMMIVLAKPDIFYIVTKYRNSRLSDDELTGHRDRLYALMETGKPYLNPEITLESLAGELGLGPRMLSQIINESCGKSFKQFILEYRLAESMKVLSDKQTSGLTILEVLYRVGFNSKSTFNNQFKLFTNMTPQEYRAKILNELN